MRKQDNIKLCLYRATKCPTEAEITGFVKTHDELLLLTLEDKNDTKYNGISFLHCNG